MSKNQGHVSDYYIAYSKQPLPTGGRGGRNGGRGRDRLGLHGDMLISVPPVSRPARSTKATDRIQPAGPRPRPLGKADIHGNGTHDPAPGGYRMQSAGARRARKPNKDRSRPSSCTGDRLGGRLAAVARP